MKRQPIIFGIIFLIISSFVFLRDNEEIQKNLHLTIMHSPTAKLSGEGILILNLTNNSSVENYKIIVPGDGSENAWREPYIYFSADFKKKNGTWQKLEYHKPLRCGNYDPDWQKDTLTILPKRTYKIYDAFFPLNSYFEIKTSGTIRLTAHYDYNQGQHQKGLADTLHDNNPNIPAFTLTSDTIEIKVIK